MREQEIFHRLEARYPNAKPALNYENAFQLLVATILSAQCTDVRVNQVTASLFVHYPDAQALASADLEELSREIHSCGCYRVKAKNLIGTAKMLCRDYAGEVPPLMEALTRLPGVGRKTANVVLSNAFDIPGLAVDTHVFRVSHRLGLSDAKDPEGTESQLCALIPREKWGKAHHWLIYHGRQVCSARAPKCGDCLLADLCPFYKEQQNHR